MKFLLIGVLVVASGCVSVSKARVAEAMACPESELVPAKVPAAPDEGAKAFAALLLMPFVGGGVAGHAIMRNAIPRSAVEQRWAGCGRTFECDREACSETGESRATRLTRAVPALMETARTRVGPDTTAEQVGYFTWDLTSPRGSSHCRVITETVFRCSPDLTEAPKTAAVSVRAPAPVSPPRSPLVAK